MAIVDKSPFALAVGSYLLSEVHPSPRIRVRFVDGPLELEGIRFGLVASGVKVSSWFQIARAHSRPPSALSIPQRPSGVL